jgi:hypothetical protein
MTNGKRIIWPMFRLPKPWCITALAAALCLFFYAKPLFFFIHAKWEVRNEPKLWNLPEPLPLPPVSRADGEAFSYFGYEFESPWNGLRQQRKTESVVLLTSSTERSIMIFAPAKEGGELYALKHFAAEEGRDVHGLFGEDARSNYALRYKELSVTPSDLRLLSSPREMTANSLFLEMKKIDSQRWSRLYRFNTEWFRGLQEGDPLLDKSVMIEAYDAADRKLMLIICAQDQAQQKLSQAEVNAILTSLRPSKS